MIRALVLLSLFSALGCTANQTEARATLEDGSELVLSLPDLRNREERDERHAYHLADGVTVTVQDIPVRTDSEPVERTADSVASALVDRIALGEEDGALTTSACTVGQLRGECVQGWMRIGRRRYERSGLVFVVGERVVWLDVAAANLSRNEVHDRARQILSSTAAIAAPTEAT